MKQNKYNLDKIKLLLLDVDGVMTDGSITIDSAKNSGLTFHVHDGYGIVQAIKNGIPVGIITGSESIAAKKRADHLGIKEFHWGVVNKIPVYEKIKNKYRLEDLEIAYIGDDLPDLPIIKKVGFSAAPKNARKELFKYVHYITKANGGKGAVREIIDLIFKSKKIQMGK
jgi:3-deoxy-D-manno-octulosonate 8-phosphate phosphatase (KDO 8-P phosphatase)